MIMRLKSSERAMHKKQMSSDNDQQLEITSPTGQ